MTNNLPKQVSEIQSTFAAQKIFTDEIAKSTVKERKAKLSKLLKHLELPEVEQKIYDAVHADFRKNSTEMMLTELGVVKSHLRFTIKNLDAWVKPKYVDTPIQLTGTSSWIMYEPKGVCLVISPWNYPFSLALQPVISAIAAGNTVIIKPSEISQHVSTLLKDIFTTLFESKEIAVFEGSVETATALLDLPFDHIHLLEVRRLEELL